MLQSTPKTSQLQQENAQLKQQLSNLETELENQSKKIEQYQQAYDNLQYQLKNLLRHRFGKRSERYVESDNPQLNLFDDNLPQTAAEQPETDNDAVEVPGHKRRKRKKKDTSKYTREIVVISVDEKDKQCECGCQKQVIRYETKELFHCKPAEYCIVEQRREVVACTSGCLGAMMTAKSPAHILPKAKATEELLANIAVSKFHHRQPLYHLEKYVDTMGISRETMARWMIALAVVLRPLFNLMKDKVIDYDVASIDATTLRVLNEPGRAPSTKSYVYCIRGGPPSTPVIYYAYNANDHKGFVDKELEGFSGYIHMDADPFFELLLDDKEVIPVYCHAHGRRKFEAVAKQSKKPGLAKTAMRFYKRLYSIEKQAKKEGLDVNARYALRQEQSKPILTEFKQWLDENVQYVLPKSNLGRAFDYVLKRWDEGFMSFLRDGRLEFDNNLTEQEIKPLVIARKNFMFAQSVEGANALCVLMTFIRTALANRLEPYQYLVHIFKALPHCQSVEEYEKLLPWAVDLPRKENDSKPKK